MTALMSSRRWSPPDTREIRRSGTQIRPGCSDDLEAMEAFMAGLSPETLYLRFLTGLGDGPPPPGLARRLLVPAVQGGSLLALSGGVVIGHAMWGSVPSADDPDETVAEIAVVVADAYQGKGIGSRLVDELARSAARQGFRHVQAVVGAENHVVRRMITGRVRDARYDRDGAEITVTVRVGSL